MTDAELQRIATAVCEATVEGCRLGIGHAIMAIAEYAADHPDAQPHCDRLASTLRHHSAVLGMDGSK